MKKLLVILTAAGLMLSFAAGELSARGIILKGGYAMMRNDLADADDTYNFGVFLDMGNFLFNSLKFKPGVDWVSIEFPDAPAANYDIWGIHMDWYWYPMGNAALMPFLGFGPALNYLDAEEDTDDDEDSDAGVDLFAGLSFGISGTPFELMLEARYRFIDIADRNDNILAFNLGIEYKF